MKVERKGIWGKEEGESTSNGSKERRRGKGRFKEGEEGGKGEKGRGRDGESGRE